MFNECFGNTLTQKIDYKLHQLRRCDDDDDVENRMWNERREREEQEWGIKVYVKWYYFRLPSSVCSYIDF